MIPEEQQLAEANCHIAEGEQRIGRQAQLIEQLARSGHSTVDARRVLETFRQSQDAIYTHRQQILAELSDEA